MTIQKNNGASFALTPPDVATRETPLMDWVDAPSRFVNKYRKHNEVPWRVANAGAMSMVERVTENDAPVWRSMPKRRLDRLARAVRTTKLLKPLERQILGVLIEAVNYSKKLGTKHQKYGPHCVWLTEATILAGLQDYKSTSSVDRGLVMLTKRGLIFIVQMETARSDAAKLFQNQGLSKFARHRNEYQVQVDHLEKALELTPWEFGCESHYEPAILTRREGDDPAILTRDTTGDEPAKIERKYREIT
jgi:hypothetical protein